MKKCEAEDLLRLLYESRDEIYSKLSYFEYIRVLELTARIENMSFTPTEDRYEPFVRILNTSTVVQ